MAGKRTGLGRGLDALFPEKNTVSKETVKKPAVKTTTKTKQEPKAGSAIAEDASESKKGALLVKISSVEPNLNQPRHHKFEVRQNL